MEDQSQPSKSSQVIQKLASGPLSSSLFSLSSSSRTLPSNQDFHFFNNFNDFKLTIDQIAKISDSFLESIGASAKTWGANKVINLPNNIESIVDDEAYDWLVDINDEIWERFDVSMDEFQKIRKKVEASGRFIGSDPDNIGFQLVNGKKKKKVDGRLMSDSAGVSVSGIEGGGLSSSGVKVKQGALAIGTTGKAKRSEDGQRFVHPLAMHGADKDIVWLQRDFGIYDSRVLKLERNSLEHLLQHFCGVTANKEYQNADWRLRPLSDEMLRSTSKVLTYVSGFNAEQLAIVAGLCEWRDNIARIEDESTGYVFPNKTLLEIAKQMPATAHKLRRLLKSKHPYVEQNLGVLVSIIRQSMQNAVAFEAAAQQLKMGRTLNIILSWLYFRANAIKEDSIMPPRSLRTR
ncbi:Polynucleotidyl transferase [Hibiscus syriacus]|uniref:Polynucleotidyl transferase n=1 Tax=Hibiscus syriacus TaxID=106335 RepID=A0A6A3B8S7_HIBSY|nr:Polynucleotidyl transferase [Hibiscus syriacus]